jgi:hypothetical protein
MGTRAHGIEALVLLLFAQLHNVGDFIMLRARESWAFSAPFFAAVVVPSPWITVVSSKSA